MTDLKPLEAHRAIVRDCNSQMARTYGFGGGGVLIAGGIYLVLAWKFFTLASVATWCILLVVLLVGLFVVRGIVNRKKVVVIDRFESFCELNEISAKDLREFFGADKLYPYFIDLFEGRSS